MPKFYVLEQIRCAVTFVRQIEAADEEDALEMDCHVSGEAVGFHLGDAMGDTMEFFALPADPANLPQPFHPEALAGSPSAAPPAPSDAPADPVGGVRTFAVTLTLDMGAGDDKGYGDGTAPLDLSADAIHQHLNGLLEYSTGMRVSHVAEATADPVKADMLAALKQIRAGAAPAGRWLAEDGNAIDGHDSEEDEPDAEDWPDATWEPYTLEEQADFLASVVAIADKAIARAEGRA